MNTDLELLKRRYVQKLDRLYGGEVEYLNVLPGMVGVAHSPALKSALQYHFEKTKAQVERLDRIFARMGIRPINFQHRETKTLAQEAQRFLTTQEEAVECDRVLISAARKMEHSEISGYLLALQYAQILRDHTAADLLEQTLKEEYEADQILAELNVSDSSRVQAKVAYGDAPNLPFRVVERQPTTSWKNSPSLGAEMRSQRHRG
jgi:ferritin-like metal-binding protein YciE